MTLFIVYNTVPSGMIHERIEHPVLAAVNLVVAGLWFLLMEAWEVPLYVNAVMWVLIFLVLFWLLVRPMLIAPFYGY